MMYELIFSVIILVNGRIGIDQSLLHKFETLDQCVAARQHVEKDMLKTARESGTLPGILECRKTI
jgi:hypothetical protein